MAVLLAFLTGIEFMGKGNRPGQDDARFDGSSNWQDIFLEHLAQTSNITKAAQSAGKSVSVAYKERSKNPDFFRQWLAALAQGYDILEFELLQRLREGELMGGSSKKARRKYDNAVALRLLAAHRESVGRQRALEANRTEDNVLEEIDRKLDQMRKRDLQARALLRSQRSKANRGS